MASQGLQKTNFFFRFKACESKTLIFVCSYGYVVFSRGETVTIHIRKNTQKSKFLLSQASKWKTIMFS